MALFGNRAAKTGRREQLDWMLNGEQPFLPPRPWLEVASFAAYSVQGDALRLKLWQSPPCHLSIEDGKVRDCDIEGQILLRRMVAAGLSTFEPDPIAALAAKAKCKRAKPKAKRPAKAAAHDGEVCR